MILEELEQTDAVTLHNVLNLQHERFKAVLVARVVNVASSISALCAGCWAINIEFKNVAVFQEIVITNLNWLVSLSTSVDFCNAGHLMSLHWETVSEHDLAEDLRCDLEVLVVVVILEEALCVKSVAANDVLEAHDHVINTLTLSFRSVFAPIFSFLICVTQNNVDAFLKVFLGENGIN